LLMAHALPARADVPDRCRGRDAASPPLMGRSRCHSGPRSGEAGGDVSLARRRGRAAASPGLGRHRLAVFARRSGESNVLLRSALPARKRAIFVCGRVRPAPSGRACPAAHHPYRRVPERRHCVSGVLSFFAIDVGCLNLVLEPGGRGWPRSPISSRWRSITTTPR
jgi:hypothetical protein